MEFPLVGYSVGLPLETGTAWFRPQPDITTYELAVCITMLLAVSTNRCYPLHEAFDKMPDEAKRHFSKGLEKAK